MTLHIVYYLKDNKRELNCDIVENNIFPGIVTQEKNKKRLSLEFSLLNVMDMTVK